MGSYLVDGWRGVLKKRGDDGLFLCWGAGDKGPRGGRARKNVDLGLNEGGMVVLDKL